MLGGSISKKDTSRLDKLIRRAGSVVGTKLDSLVTVAESRTLDKLLDIMDNASHPLHTVISNQRSLFSERLLLPKCRTNRLKNSFCVSSLSDMRPTMVVSSANFTNGVCGVDGRTVTDEESEEGWAEHTALWCACAQDQCRGCVVPDSHHLRPLVRKSLIQWHSDEGSLRLWSFSISLSRITVLKAELKSTNSILT
ncbi:hypothetical protein L3Q82_000658 [Scortum barcoo]|uniref:Uncharacterized protein n=1 Tax=Scortum barcoo TaxID=214431 RepID=A0ACB8WFB3_9TELE|nr:hypothetical protein L3Q82_000658 [Scortum barcoo]